MARERFDSPAGTQRRNRRYSRRAVDLDAEFSPVNIKLNVPTNISTIHGLIKNMSPAGLFVELPILYRVGTRFQVRVPIEGRIETFYAIVWRVAAMGGELPSAVGAREKDSQYGHGLKITTASESTLRALFSFLNASLEAAGA